MTIETIADRLLRRYTIRRQEKYPSYACDPSRYGPDFWQSVAQIVYDLKADPESFVDLLFACWDKRSNDMPPPNLLKTKRHIDNWKIKPIAERSQCSNALENMFKLFVSYLNAGVPAISILTDDQLYFNPIFRYAMAYKLELFSLADTFKESAKAYLKENPGYFEPLKQYLPEGFNA